MLHVEETIDQVIHSAAEFFVEQSGKAIKTHGSFTVALSGGSSPKKLFSLLASNDFRSRIDWLNIYFFFGDERFVPADDEQSNYRMAKETLFAPLYLPPHHIFPVNTNVAPADAAAEYEKTIRKQLGSEGRFDLIWLGLGDDAHTASLFPGTQVLEEKQAWVKEVFVKKVGQYRITFTASLINRAATIAFLTYGASKSEAVFHIMKDPFTPEKYPAQLIKPASGNVHWFLDQEAARKIL